MAQYKVNELSYIGNRLVQPGEVVEFDGEPGPNLDPIEEANSDADAKAKQGSK